ncbi:MAG: hypothetical protein CV087_08245 [Candidatus Brocadia sp. WS118]|nr:MAG: hypothetical protein CV087_08245 [Candidatus Brocadia sp. WS118]
MTCNHNEILRFLAQDTMLADGICPICLQAKLAQAVKVIEAVERFKISVERILDPSDEEYIDISKELTAAIANFKATPQSGQDAPR